MKSTAAHALPGFDAQTLQGHLLTVAHTIAAAAASSQLEGDSDTAKRLRECATVAARIAQAMGRRAPRSTLNADRELDALKISEAAFLADDPLAESRCSQNTDGVRRLDPEALERYLQRHPLGKSDVTLKEASILSGGRCKLTALIRHSGGCELPETLIMRQDWDGGATNTTVADEFRLLNFLHGEEMLVARPYLLESGSSDVGLPFMLMQRMPGALRAGLFEPPTDPELAIALARQLGRLHAIPLAKARMLTLPEWAVSETSIREVLAQFHSAHGQIGIASAIIDAAIGWLADNLELFGCDRSLVHNDLGFHNCLTEGSRLTAVLDWELAEIGHPAADLGYVKHFVQRMMPWEQFLAEYRSAGGWQGSTETLRFHTIWNAVRLYGLIMRARAATAAGLVRDIEISHACADNLVLLLIFLGSELESAQAR